MASFVDENLVNNILRQIVPFTDSIGCNEQELPNIYAALSGEKLVTVADSMPKVANILDILRATYKMLQNVNSDRTTSRIHVHTLAYQLIIQKDDTKFRKMWPNIKQAAAKAAVTAVRHICQNDNVPTTDVKILLDNSFRTTVYPDKLQNGNPSRIYFKNDESIACWSENYGDDHGKVQICLAVGLVCTNVKQTAGGGDNISAAALSAQF